MADTHPKVSIGMPVFNGEQFIESALASAVRQTYSDFEIIICDNGSSDRTPEICQAFASHDRRIRYIRNPENIGAAKNFNKTFELASGPYFKWLAHDDVLADDYIEKCVQALEQAPPGVVMVFPRTTFIDHKGDIIKPCSFVPKVPLEGRWAGYHALTFSELMVIPHEFIPSIIFGVMRSDALRKTRLIEGYIGSDRGCAADLCLLGEVWQLPDNLFFQRKHAVDSWRVQLSKEEDAAWYDPSNEGRRIRPDWELYVGLFQAVRRSGLPRSRKALRYLQSLTYLLGRLRTRAMRRTWDMWSRMSLLALVATKHTFLPLYVWAWLREVRKLKGRAALRRRAEVARTDKYDLLAEFLAAAFSRPDPRSERLVLDWLRDPLEYRRVAAARVLARHPQRFSRLLHQHLADEDNTQVRGIITAALGGDGPP